MEFLGSHPGNGFQLVRASGARGDYRFLSRIAYMIKGTLSAVYVKRFKRVALRPTSLRLSTMIVDVDRQTLSTIRNSICVYMPSSI